MTNEEFNTGAIRDIQDNKPRFDLLPIMCLKRLSKLYESGAIKYGENNYQKGMPFKRVYASLFRHLVAWREGETGEDHLAAIAWNAFALMYFEEMIKSGKLPKELDDRGDGF